MRREFPKAVRREAFDRSNGICECALVPALPTYGKGCDCKLGPGNTFYEHINPDGNGGTNDIANCAVLTKTCWLFKSRFYDAPVVAKALRMRDRAINAQTETVRPLPGTKRSGIKLSFSHSPCWRDSGAPIIARRS